MKSLFLSIIALMSCTLLLGQTPTGNMIIKNGTVLTVTNGTLENTDGMDGQTKHLANMKLMAVGTNYRCRICTFATKTARYPILFPFEKQQSRIPRCTQQKEQKQSSHTIHNPNQS